MIKELLESLNQGIEVSEDYNDYTYTNLEVYEVNIDLDEHNKDFIMKQIVSRLMTKDVKFEHFEMRTDFRIVMHIIPKEMENLRKAFEEIVGEIKLKGKNIDIIYSKINELSMEESQTILKRVIAMLF